MIRGRIQSVDKMTEFRQKKGMDRELARIDEVSLAFSPTFGLLFPRSDPCSDRSPTELWKASRTPNGPGTLHLFVRDRRLHARAFGPGADWLMQHAPRIASLRDEPETFDPSCPKLKRLQLRTRGLRLGQTPTVLDSLLPTILGQRVKVYEARRSWSRIVRDLGDLAPGPRPLFLPPDPQRLLRAPSWWFAQHGVDDKRARAMVEVCRHARRFNRATPAELTRLVRLVRGLGPWTLGNVRLRAFGDPDALIVGDYHLPHAVTFFFTGEPRGTDEQMLALLEPFTGHRARALLWVKTAGTKPPRVAPRQRFRFTP